MPSKSCSSRVRRISVAPADTVSVRRIVALSIKRLWILDRRFAASKGDRYVLSIEAVMYSIIEANVAIICTNLPALGYRLFFDWFEANEARRPRGRERRDTIVGGHEIELQTVNQVEDLERQRELRAAYEMGVRGDPSPFRGEQLLA